MPRVDVVWKWEWSCGKEDVIRNDTVLPFCRHEFFDDWVKGEAVGAEEVFKELDLDVTFAFTGNPSRVSAIDRRRVWSKSCSSSCKSGSEGKFHL